MADELLENAEQKWELCALSVSRGAAGAFVVGALAMGALAIGALAIGAVAVGRLSIGKMNVSTSKEDECKHFKDRPIGNW